MGIDTTLSWCMIPSILFVHLASSSSFQRWSFAVELLLFSKDEALKAFGVRRKGFGENIRWPEGPAQRGERSSGTSSPRYSKNDKSINWSNWRFISRWPKASALWATSSSGRQEFWSSAADPEEATACSWIPDSSEPASDDPHWLVERTDSAEENIRFVCCAAIAEMSRMGDVWTLWGLFPDSVAVGGWRNKELPAVLSCPIRPTLAFEPRWLRFVA